MKNGRMQVKDIPDDPILQFLLKLKRKEIEVSYGEEGNLKTWRPPTACSFGPEFGQTFANSVALAMPGVPWRLRLRKMDSLIRRGLAEGCACGCRGDFELTEKGGALLEQAGSGT